MTVETITITGIDTALLDEQRLILNEALTSSGLTPAQADALEGVVNMLNEWSDARSEPDTRPNDICPFCKSGDLQGDAINAEWPAMWQVVDCQNCGESFQQVYLFSHSETMGGKVIPAKS